VETFWGEVIWQAVMCGLLGCFLPASVSPGQPVTHRSSHSDISLNVEPRRCCALRNRIARIQPPPTLTFVIPVSVLSELPGCHSKHASSGYPPSPSPNHFSLEHDSCVQGDSTLDSSTVRISRYFQVPVFCPFFHTTAVTRSRSASTKQNTPVAT
jgi:hypothetical protein